MYLMVTYFSLNTDLALSYEFLFLDSAYMALQYYLIFTMMVCFGQWII